MASRTRRGPTFTNVGPRALRGEIVVDEATARRLRRARWRRVLAGAFSVAAIAGYAASINSSVENIGARRLFTVMERVLDEINFTATDQSGTNLVIDRAYVDRHIGDLAKDVDLSRFIL